MICSKRPAVPRRSKLLVLGPSESRLRAEYSYESSGAFFVVNNPQMQRGGFEQVDASLSCLPDHDAGTSTIGGRNLFDEELFRP